MKQKGWFITEDSHVVPIDDEISHERLMSCWCGPSCDGP